ncbi:MAG: polymer-forming cytoskeletal protein [Lachnospiraceae bacterium]|nr:polymer-forming cytoskeletal protein [Lachnospiraceae bacterium]
MGFFQDLKEDLSQAVTELVPEEEKEAVIDEKQAEDDLAEIEAMLREKEDAKKEEKKERKIDMNAIFNQPFSDEVSNITAGMVINGDIKSQGSLELVGAVHGNINIAGKMSITGVIEGNSQAAEVYAESAKITGEVRSLGTVKVGQETVIIGNIFATSAVIAGAVKGDIDVHGPVILDTTAIVMGNIKSKSVQINNGAVIEGMCSQCYADVNPTSFFDEIKKAGRKNK